MSAAPNPLTDPTELGPVKPREPAKLTPPEQRIAALPKVTYAQVVEIAERVWRAKNPLRAATLVSTREILALCEVVLRTDAAAAEILLEAGQADPDSTAEGDNR